MQMIQHAIYCSRYWKIWMGQQKPSIFVPVCHTKLLPLVHTTPKPAPRQRLACVAASHRHPGRLGHPLGTSLQGQWSYTQRYWCRRSSRQMKQSYKAHFIHQGVCQQLLVCSAPSAITASRERYPPAVLHPAFSGRAEQSQQCDLSKATQNEHRAWDRIHVSSLPSSRRREGGSGWLFFLRTRPSFL